VIYISHDQLNQVEYLIQQSMIGNHVLFEPEMLAQVFQGLDPSDALLSEEEAYEVEHHIEKLIELPNLSQKRAYLEVLDAPTYEQVVLTYFNIVDNNLFERVKARH